MQILVTFFISMEPASSHEEESDFKGIGAWHWNNGNCSLCLTLQFCAQIKILA
jgi:hypothetical protein